MKTATACIAIFTLFNFGQAPYSFAAEYSNLSQKSHPTKICASLFTSSNRNIEKIRTAVREYLSDVYQTRGRRLVLKSNTATSPDSLQMGGLLHIRAPIKNWHDRLRFVFLSLPVQFVGIERYRDYELDPLRAFYDWTVRRPIGFVSQRTLGQKLEPSNLVKFAFAIALSLMTYSQVNAYYDSALTQKIDADIAEHRAEYLDEIQYDFRFHTIYQQLEKGHISIDLAIRESYQLNLAYNQYYSYRDSVGEFTNLASDMKLIHQMLFSQLAEVIEHGLHEKRGFIIPPERVGPISDKQKLELFNIYHLLYLKYQLVSEIANNTRLFQTLNDSASNEPLLKGILSDPFTETILRLRDQGKLLPKETQALLQEDAYWQAQFDIYKILGIAQQKIINGSLTNQPLTHNNIRDEILKSLRQ